MDHTGIVSQSQDPVQVQGHGKANPFSGCFCQISADGQLVYHTGHRCHLGPEHQDHRTFGDLFYACCVEKDERRCHYFKI